MMNIIKLIFSIIICEVAGMVGAIFTSQSVSTWYQTINRPSFNPPSWVFAPVWTILFALMGIAVFLIWSRFAKTAEELDKKKIKSAVIIFIIQLLVNIFWSVAFFGLKSPFLGFIVIIVLWILILLTIIKFFGISKVASWLLIPYILWVSFASILNFAIMILNK